MRPWGDDTLWPHAEFTTYIMSHCDRPASFSHLLDLVWHEWAMKTQQTDERRWLWLANVSFDMIPNWGIARNLHSYWWWKKPSNRLLKYKQPQHNTWILNYKIRNVSQVKKRGETVCFKDTRALILEFDNDSSVSHYLVLGHLKSKSKQQTLPVLQYCAKVCLISFYFARKKGK